MAIMNDDAQWLVLLGLIICVSIISLAVIINESVLVGQTTAESVLDFSKSDIQGLHGEVLRNVILTVANSGSPALATDKINSTKSDIEALYLIRKHALVNITADPRSTGVNITIHYNNGVTSYYETLVFNQ